MIIKRNNRVGLSFLALTTLIAAQPALRIASPTDGTKVHPGDTLTVVVEASPPGTFQSVIIFAWDPIPASKLLTAPPYRFAIQIPSDIVPKEYLLTAVGVQSPGQGTASESVSIIVERADTPVRLRVEPTVLDLSPSQKGYLRVLGEYSDGKTVDLTQAGGVFYSSTAPTVAIVQAQGIVTSVSAGSCNIVVSFKAAKAQVPVIVRNRR